GCIEPERSYFVKHIFIRKTRKNISGKFCKSHSHSCNRSGLNYSKKTPPIQKSNELVVRFFQINILPSRFRKHRTQFSIRKCCNHSNHTRQSPSQNKPARTSDIEYHI